jgi:hypothetical protein
MKYFVLVFLEILCYIFIVYLPTLSGRAIAQAVSRRLPGSEPRSGRVGFVVDKVAWVRFSPITSVSPASYHSTDCSTFIIIHHSPLVQ